MHVPTTRRRVAAGFGAITLCLIAAPAGAGDVDPMTRYRQEQAACLLGPPERDEAACLRDARAALAESRRGTLDGSPHDYAANAIARCAPLPAGDREDCVARIHGQGTVSGSVEGGGLYREFVRKEIARPAQ